MSRMEIIPVQGMHHKSSRKHDNPENPDFPEVRLIFPEECAVVENCPHRKMKNRKIF
jgi:hypothetical protein